MRRDLFFLKGSQYSGSFREVRGHDDEFLLTKENVKEVTTGPGVYIIVAEDKTKFIYPLGNSSVMYIGKADNLRRRLREHLKNLQETRINERNLSTERIVSPSRYHYMDHFGAYVYIYNCLKETQPAKDLEATIIFKFYEKFRALPVGNGAMSFGKLYVK